MLQPYFAELPPHPSLSGGAGGEERRQQLLTLHHWLQRRFATWQLALHPHWLAERVVLPQVGQGGAVCLELAYGRSAEELAIALRAFAFPEVSAQSFRQSALIILRLTDRELSIAFQLGELAWLDATNLANKLQHSAQARATLLGILTDLFNFGYAVEQRLGQGGLGRGTAPVKLLAAWENVGSQHGQLYLGRTLPLTDPVLSRERIGWELFAQIRLLYRVYQFVRWSPENHYIW